MIHLRKKDPLRETEVEVYKRDFNAAQRKQLASEKKALPDGSYPIETAADLHPAAVLIRSGHGDVEAATALVKRRAKELGATDPLAENTKKADDLRIETRIWKADREGKVYTVVLEPNLPDSQDDEVTPEEIEKACHRYMVESRKADIQHNEQLADADLIENWIAPQDLQLAGQPVTKGSWVQAWQVNDPVVKREIDEGKLTGSSIGGSAFRDPA